MYVEVKAALFTLVLLAVTLLAVVVIGAHADSYVYVNVTNETVYVKFGNMTVINFTTTLVSLGWLNSTHIACAYSCLYAYSIEQDCDSITVQVFEGTVLRYQTDFNPSSNNTSLCPPELKGLCYGAAIYDVSNFTEPARILIINNDRNQTEGPIVFDFPYEGPELKGYAQYIPVIVAVGTLIGLAGRISMKNVGIGLLIFGLISPLLVVLGAEMKNAVLAMTFSIIMGVILIWFSNQ